MSQKEPSPLTHSVKKGSVTMEQLMEILEELRPDVDFKNEKALVTGGILDSFDIISLVSNLNDEFDITIRPANLVPENFDSAEAMLALIKKLQDEE